MQLTRNFMIKWFFILTAFMLLAGCSSAGSPVDFQTMLQNLARSYPDLWKLFTATAYVIGFSLFMKAIYTLKIYGEARTMMSSNASIKGPVFFMLAGTMLIFLPSAFTMINLSFFGTSNILSYTSGSVGAFSQASVAAVMGAVQVVGILAFIRGWLYLSRAGDQHGGQPVTGKALTHIIGGALAINIVQVKDVIWNTFGFG